MFTAEPGKILVDADYSQITPRSWDREKAEIP